MRFRLAKKIVKTVGTAAEGRYSVQQVWLAQNRLDRTRSERENKAFMYALMDVLGVSGRAAVLAGTGAPGMALDLLMRTPEEDWEPKTQRR